VGFLCFKERQYPILPPQPCPIHESKKDAHVSQKDRHLFSKDGYVFQKHGHEIKKGGYDLPNRWLWPHRTQ